MTDRPHRALVDGAGRTVRLGQVLGRGGEGAVYEVPASPELVAKVYHDPLSTQRADKIVAMGGMGTETLRRLTAWPVDLLREAAGRTAVGLLMPRVTGRKDVHNLYSPKSRRAEFTRADWRFLIRAATNTARAFAAVHEAGCVIGDVNHGGVLVAQDATVTLIDCDSFEVVHAGRRYPCEVGVETFTPPELQGKPFAGVVRTATHDEFGLAVMTFLLLFMGRHPFAGRFSGAGDMPISRAIEEVRFAYGRNRAAVGMVQPPGTPSLTIVGPKVEDLFERAFSRPSPRTGRPTAREWVTALAALEGELTQCAANQAHWHRTGTTCPWCPMEGATGVDLFPTVVQVAAGSAFDIARLWRQVEALAHPGALPSIDVPTPDASREATAFGGWTGRRHALSAALALLVALGAAVVGPVAFLAAAVAYAVTYAALDRSSGVRPFRVACDAASAVWSQAEAEWRERAGPGPFDAARANLTHLKASWNGLPDVRAARLRALQRDREKAQREHFLDRFEIEKAKIDGIGKGKKQVLASYGIETAADVTPARILQVPGFGPKTQERLTNWRRSLERRFVFDPLRPVDPRETAKVEAEIVAERRRIEDGMSTGLADLRQAGQRIEAARIHLRPRVEAARRGYLQARADLDAAT